MNERITVFHFDSFTAVVAYSRFWCIVVVIDTRGFVAFCSSLDGCYELVSSIKRGFCFDDLVRLGFQHIMRSTLFFFLRSSVHCLNSLQQSTLIAVVRHLKFIDFIQLALRTNRKKITAHQTHSHINTSFAITLFSIFPVFFFHKPLLNATYNSQYFIAILAFDVFSHFSHCCWRIYIGVKECYIHQQPRQEKRKKNKRWNRFYITNDIRISIEWRFLWLQRTFEFMTNMIYSNVHTTKCHSFCFLTHRLYSADTLISLAFHFFSSSLARRIPSTNNNLLTITPI